MRMGTVGRVNSTVLIFPLLNISRQGLSRLLTASLILVGLASFSGWSQTPVEALQRNFDNGHFEAVAAGAQRQLLRSGPTSARASLLAIRSLTVLERYGEAEIAFDRALAIVRERDDPSGEIRAELFLTRSAIARARRDFRGAVNFANTARLAAPKNRQIEIGYYYAVARTLFSSGLDVAAIIWLEKAELLFDTNTERGVQLEVYRYLSLAWSSKFHYAKSIEHAEKLIALSEGRVIGTSTVLGFLSWPEFLTRPDKSERLTNCVSGL